MKININPQRVKQAAHKLAHAMKRGAFICVKYLCFPFVAILMCFAGLMLWADDWLEYDNYGGND